MSSLRSTVPQSTPSPALKFKFGNLARAARHAHGFPNQAGAAAHVGMTRFHLWEIETNRIPPTEAERARLFHQLPMLRVLVELAVRLESPSHNVETAGRL